MLYRWLTSGRRSLSTRMGRYSRLMRSMTPWFEYDLSSMTWHQWHQTAEIDRRMGRSREAASPKAFSDQGRHLISLARLGRGEKWNSLPASRGGRPGCEAARSGGGMESGMAPSVRAVKE